MNAFVLSPAARDDLRNIWKYIAQDSFDAADRVIDRIHEAMIRLAEMPGMGIEHEDLADETLRVWPIFSYLIIFRSDREPIEIVRVVRASRDLTAIHFH